MSAAFRIAGVDLGQSTDPSALVMLERQLLSNDVYGPVDERPRVVSIRQWPLDTDYTELADEILGYGADALVVEINGPGRPMLDLLRRRARERNYRGRIHGVATAASNVRPRLLQDEPGQGKVVVVPKAELVWAITELQRKGTYAVCPKCNQYAPAVEMDCPTILKHKRTGELRRCGGKIRRVGGGLVIPVEMEQGWQMILEQMKVFEQIVQDNGMMTFNHRGKKHHCDAVIAMGIACWWLNRFFKRRQGLGVYQPGGDDGPMSGPWTDHSVRTPRMAW